MRLTTDATNRLVDAAGRLLDAGSLRIYEGGPTAALRELLVTVLFQSPAFTPATDGVAVAHPMDSAVIEVTGTARWAEFVTASGMVVADLTVRSADAEDLETADVVVDRTDFHRGGLCTIARVVLRLPRSS